MSDSTSPSRADPSRPGWTRVRLNAAAAGALSDPKVHDTVVSSAEAIAERTGVVLVSIEVDERGVTAVVEGGRLEALGLAAELRRLTGAWYARHAPGEHLWIEPPDHGDAEGGDDTDAGGNGDDDGPGSFGLPEFKDPYAFNDEDLHTDGTDDQDEPEDPEDPDSPDDPDWRTRDDPLGP